MRPSSPSSSSSPPKSTPPAMTTLPSPAPRPAAMPTTTTTTTQPLAHQACSPVPGSAGYRTLQLQAVTEALAAMPEPGTTAAYPDMHEAQQWSQAIAYGESQIARFGPRVHLSVLRMTLLLQSKLALARWRTFRFMDLPPEIISNIFHLVVWSTSHPSEGVKQRLRLTWVCKTWRRLMIEDPLIWNAIWFHDPPPYERSWAWFERAGTARLDIRLNEADSSSNSKQASKRDAPKFTAEQMCDILGRLFTKLSQIRMLVVIVDHWPPALTVLQRLQSAGNANIPINIERLEVHRSGTPFVWKGPGFDTHGHRDPPVLFGGQTHRLQYLCLSGIHIDFDDTPLSNLTSLDLRHIAMDAAPTLERFREILQNCPNLDKLTLDGCGPQLEPRRFDHKPVELPKLRIFTLGSVNLPFACYIVAQIHAPRVRDLTLMNMTGCDYIPLVGMLTRKFVQVRILTLYSVQLEMNPAGRRTFVRWLDTMPEIGYARLARMKADVLRLFAENPMSHRRPLDVKAAADAGITLCDVLCPKFQCMEVQVLPPETIAEFCRLRAKVGVPMKKLYLNPPWVEKLNQEEVKILREVAALYVAPMGTNTAEERMLLSDGWES